MRVQALKLLLPLAIACLATRAAAQDSIRVVLDSTAFPADTVRVHPRLATGMGGCAVPRAPVVRDSAQAAALLAFPQCHGARLPDLRKWTMVAVRLWGDCHAMFGVRFWRSDSTRRYIVRVTTYDGGCRAMGRGEMRWYLLPRLPPDWTVAGMHVRRSMADLRPGAELEP